ncbi:DOPA 4,5-dioxygenase [Paraburkholderia silvatlantica]|uniref:DOPA 4,5-dioxygenase n=3 Tax=Paraburkholderia silvatlantica TaxID=321895 RepID=A0ABR6FZR0_9BURK|nr:DOPA 4,5-dioxygenase [Paraburkholderia silvatlantica]
MMGSPARRGHSMDNVGSNPYRIPASAMNDLDPADITSWHAHVYFDAATRDAAWTLREAIEARFGEIVQIGRFHERPVGPHPMWSYQLVIAREHFTTVVEWLTLNHGALDVFVHPNTSNALRDHRDAAVWIGHSHRLDLGALGG